MRISLSIGDWPPKTSRTIVSPMRQTRLPCPHVVVGEGVALVELFPVAGDQERGGGAADRPSAPSSCCRRSPGCGPRPRTATSATAGHSRRICSQFGRRELDGGSHAEADAVAVGRAGLDQHVVGPHAGDRGLQGRLRALADLHHGDHRAHADDHAQGGQRGTQLVAAQRARSGPQRRRQAAKTDRAEGSAAPAPARPPRGRDGLGSPPARLGQRMSAGIAALACRDSRASSRSERRHLFPRQS